MTKVFCAIDRADPERAAGLVRQLSGTLNSFKLGLEFFTAQGPAGVDKIRAVAAGAEIFLDLKLHDIPNTVAGAVRAAMRCRPEFLTVHASGGREMIRAAVGEAGAATKILAVTVLTSLDDAALQSVGQSFPVRDQVLLLARLAVESGAHGIVCSPQETELLRKEFGKDIFLVVPGIRPAGTAWGDQKRTMTPQAAAARGADYLVIGRPITEAPDPAAAAREILAQLTPLTGFI